MLVHNLYLSHVNHCQVTLLCMIFLQVVLVVPLWVGKVRMFVYIHIYNIICYCN